MGRASSLAMLTSTSTSRGTRSARRFGGLLGEDSTQQRRNLASGNAEVHGPVPQCVPWASTGANASFGILHDRDAAQSSDRVQARGAIVQVASEDHADRGRTVDLRRRTEQRIDGRPREILARSAAEPELARLDDEVPIDWRDVDAAVFQPLTILGIASRQRTGAAQDARGQPLPIAGAGESRCRLARQSPRARLTRASAAFRRPPDDVPTTTMRLMFAMCAPWRFTA